MAAVAQQWGGEVREREDGQSLLVKLHIVADQLRSTDRHYIADVLQARLEAWSLTGRDPSRFRRAEVSYGNPDRGGWVTATVDRVLDAADGHRSPRPPVTE